MPQATATRPAQPTASDVASERRSQTVTEDASVGPIRGPSLLRAADADSCPPTVKNEVSRGDGDERPRS